jgi:hypothetical protein
MLSRMKVQLREYVRGVEDRWQPPDWGATFLHAGTLSARQTAAPGTVIEVSEQHFAKNPQESRRAEEQGNVGGLLRIRLLLTAMTEAIKRLSWLARNLAHCCVGYV